LLAFGTFNALLIRACIGPGPAFHDTSTSKQPVAGIVLDWHKQAWLHPATFGAYVSGGALVPKLKAGPSG